MSAATAERWRRIASSIPALVAQGDFWRRSPSAAGGPSGHKEWSHFYVVGERVSLLVNFSVMDDAAGCDAPRVALLARDAEGCWHGDVDSLDPGSLALAGGGIDARFGESWLRFRDGVYHVHAKLARTPVAAHLTLRPLARPALTTSVPLGRGESMKWFVVPRLVADGEISLAGERHLVRGAPAYHDHDWGRFHWGGDFGWDWSIALPESASGAPWTLIFQRFSDRARHQALSQGILLWRGPRHVRTLHGPDLHCETSGRLSAAGALRIPRVFRLAAPGCAADLPRRIELRAADGRDVLEVTYELRDLAQLAIPNDGPTGTTLINEAHAELRAEGNVLGERVRLAGSALVESKRAAA